MGQVVSTRAGAGGLKLVWCFGLVCATSVPLAACDGDENGTNVSRSSDDDTDQTRDDDRADDAGERKSDVINRTSDGTHDGDPQPSNSDQTRDSERTTESEATSDGVQTSASNDEQTNDEQTNDEQTDTQNADEVFTIVDYYRTTCDYYTRCSADLLSVYGNKDQCLQYLLSFTRPSSWERAEGWPRHTNTTCLRNLVSLECPATQVPTREPVEAYLGLLRGIFACVDVDPLPCSDDDDCPTGKCSGNAAKCGICEPPPEGQCKQSYHCAPGEACWDGQCGPPRAKGAECVAPEHCASGQCRNLACVDVLPEGAECETSLECGTYMWCKEGVCARPGALGAACEVGVLLSCQLGYACVAGTCQAAGYEDVPVGGVCVSTGSCVPGASCSTESVCEPTGNECAIDLHCPEDHYCSTTCIPKGDVGADCTSALHCKSAYCSDAKLCAERLMCE